MNFHLLAGLGVFGVSCWTTTTSGQTQLYRLPTEEGRAPYYFLADSIGWFENGPARVQVGERFVYVDRLGRVVAPEYGAPAFEEAHGFGFNGLAVVRSNGKFGYIDRSGQWVVDPVLEFADSFLFSPHAVVRKDGKYGVISQDGKLLVPFKYEGVEALLDAGFMLFNGDSWAVADRDGRELTPFHFDALGNQLSRVSEGMIPAKYNGRWGFASAETGEMVVPPQYDSVGVMSEGFANFTREGKIGYVDRSGRVIVESDFERADQFSDGFAAVKMAGRWGYIDKNGKVAIEPIFERAERFREGHASVIREGGWVTIDAQGIEVPTPPEEPPVHETLSDTASAVTEPQRCTVRFDHLNLGMTLLWDGESTAKEVRVFRLDSNQSLVWDGRFSQGRMHGGLFVRDGKLVVIDSAEGFPLDRIEQEVGRVLQARQRALAIVSGGSTPEMKVHAIATLQAILAELKALQTLEKTYFDRRFDVDLDASNETDAAANRIAKARTYVDRLKVLSARIDKAITDLDALNDDQRHLLDKIRNDAAEIAQQVLRLN